MLSPGQAYGVMKNQSEVESLAESAAFWLTLSTNRLNQGEEAWCPRQQVTVMEMLACAFVHACVCRAGAGTGSDCYGDGELYVCVLTGTRVSKAVRVSSTCILSAPTLSGICIFGCLYTDLHMYVRMTA